MASMYKLSIEQASDPERPPTARELAKERYERVKDFIHEMKDEGMDDWDIDRAVEHGKINYRKARRESAEETE